MLAPTDLLQPIKVVTSFTEHPVSSLTAKSLAAVILAKLSDLKHPVINLICKGFDGADNMSSEDEGVQQHLSAASAKFAVYFLRFADRLFSSTVWKSYKH